MNENNPLEKDKVKIFKNPTNKIISILKNKQCPICKNHFVFSCIKCKFFDEILTQYFLKHIDRFPSNLYEYRRSNSIIILYQNGGEIFKIDTKEIPLPNSIEIPPDYKTNSLPITGRNASSTSTVKEKKSSNIFSSFVKKARRKKTVPIKVNSGNEEIKNLHISSQNVSCASTISLGVHVEEVEISCQSYDKKGSQNQNMDWEEKGACSEPNTSNHSLVFSSTSTKNPDKPLNLLSIQYCNPNFKDNLVQTSQRQNIDQSPFTKNQEVATERYKEENHQYSTAVSSFVPFEKSIVNISLADGLQYIQETVSSLQESENHITSLIAKYITDPSVQKQLLTAISQHNKLQWNAERRSCSLANDMWMQQLEIGRAQEKILQETLNSLVKQNRQLQIDNENLYRKHEKAVKMLRGSENRPRCQEHDAQVDSVLRHNEKLQVKLDTVFKKCESLEAELLIFQRQNDSMEQQLRNGTVKMQNLKATIYKMKTEYELEQTALNFKLESKEQILQEALEAGDILVDDLDGLKRQLKNVPFGLNWSKFKIKESCLTELIHMSRSCINELSKEILNMHMEIALKDKDISTLRETNTKLQENLEKSTTELETMSKKIEDNFSVTTSKLLNEQKCQILEHELANLEEKIEELKKQIGLEKSLRIKSIDEFEMFKKEVQEKDKVLEQNRMFVANVTSENCSLKNDITMLNQMLKESGAGDVAREMENTQQEMEHFHKELRQIQKENRCLITEVGILQNQNAVLTANHEAKYINLQKQEKELEKMTEEVQTFRQKFDAEHQTVLSLQNERKKYLEEKNILKSIIQHLKNELSKMRNLEQNLSNVTKEASKLGMVAEYNKQQGEKLKKEVIERESVIAHLKSSVQKLNDLHMQNVKEKLSLCYELNEVCQLKEKLSEVLNTEVKKNAELGQSNESIVKSVTCQIQKIEEKQRNERTAIRILLKDIKLIGEEKEGLSREKNKLQLEIDYLNNKCMEQEKKCDELSKEIAKNEQENAELRKERDHFEKKQKEFNERFKNEESKYDMSIKQLKKLIEQLRNEKKDLLAGNECLKKNVGKLQKDLDSSRQSEKEHTELLHKTKQQQEEAQNVLNEQTELVKTLKKEKDKLEGEKMKLIKETNYLNTIMEKVVADFEKSITTSEEKERLFKSEFDESKKLLIQYVQEIQDLNKTIDLKEKKIDEFSEMAKNERFHQEKYIKLKEEMKKLQTDATNVKPDNTKMEKELKELQSAYDEASEHLLNVEKQMFVLEKQLKFVLEKKEEDFVFYKKHIAELLRTRDEIEDQNEREICSLRQQLEDVQNKIANEKAAYETLSEIHKEVSGKFMKSIKDLVNVKNSKQEIADKLKENHEKIAELENEKNDLNTQINKLIEEIDTSKHLVVQLNEENNLLQKSYNKALDKCVSLEYEIKRIELDHHQEVKEVGMKNEQNNDLQQVIENSKKELEATNTTIHKLKMEIATLKQDITLLQIERSEITLECHETKKKLNTEKNLSEQLKNTHKLLLAAVLQLKEEGKVDPSDCLHLLHMIRSSSSFVADDASGEGIKIS